MKESKMRLCRAIRHTILPILDTAKSSKFFECLLTVNKIFRRRVEQDKNNISKYEIVRDVIIRLNEAGDVALRERREIIKRVFEFKDFSGCWPDDQIPARGLVARVRESINHTDSSIASLNPDAPLTVRCVRINDFIKSY